MARLGFVAGLLSRPVLIGYLAGVAVLMIVSQLGKVTGLQISGERLWDELGSLLAQLDENLPTFLLATASVRWPCSSPNDSHPSCPARCW